LFGFTSKGDHVGTRDQLGKQFEPLRREFGGNVAEPRDVAARAGETGDKADLDRIGDKGEDDRDRRGGGFRRQRPRRPGVRHDHIDLAANEIGGQGG
jgi:hypothetical protein